MDSESDIFEEQLSGRATLAPEPADEESRDVRAMILGDAEARDRVIVRMSPFMLRYSRYMLAKMSSWSAAPEDIVQDVWISALPRLSKLTPNRSSPDRLTPGLKAMIRMALQNRVKDECRWAVRQMVTAHRDGIRPAEDPVCSNRGPISQLLAQERSNVVADALDRLGEREQELLVKRMFHGVGPTALAEDMGMTLEAVTKALQRAKHRLSDVLSEAFLEDLLID